MRVRISSVWPFWSGCRREFRRRWREPTMSPSCVTAFKPIESIPTRSRFHAKIVDNKIDRQGELVYKVLSANEDQAVLKTSGSAAWQLGQLGMMRFPRMGPPFMHRAPEGTTVSRRGTVLVSGELTHLPMLLGDLETLVIDEFPDEAAATWEKQRDLVIQEIESGGRFGPRFGPPIPLLPGSTATARHTAKEVVTFTVAETSDDLVAHQREVLARRPATRTSRAASR